MKYDEETDMYTFSLWDEIKRDWQGTIGLLSWLTWLDNPRYGIFSWIGYWSVELKWKLKDILTSNQLLNKLRKPK